YKGHGTWFIPSIHGGSIGSCQKFEGDSDYIVAMNAKQYGEMTGVSGWCFKKIRIFSGDKSVVATVTDACPECQYGDLDMTPAVFKKLGNLDQGIISIKW
ncbi:RlpA-like double-psi beta-barrel-protein domain-containing protein-containing protein, partial [Syncephalastrum racemosum]